MVIITHHDHRRRRRRPLHPGPSHARAAAVILRLVGEGSTTLVSTKKRQASPSGEAIVSRAGLHRSNIPDPASSHPFPYDSQCNGSHAMYWTRVWPSQINLHSPFILHSAIHHPETHTTHNVTHSPSLLHAEPSMWPLQLCLTDPGRWRRTERVLPALARLRPRLPSSLAQPYAVMVPSCKRLPRIREYTIAQTTVSATVPPYTHAARSFS